MLLLLFSRGPGVLLQEDVEGGGEGPDGQADQARGPPQHARRQDALAQERLPHYGKDVQCT